MELTKRSVNIPHLSGSSFSIDVNWNAHVTPCKVLRLRVGDKETLVDRDQFFALLFLFTTPEQSRAIVAKEMQMNPIKQYSTVLGVTAKKDIHKGEKINIPVTFDIPISEEERVLLEARGKKVKPALAHAF